MQNINRGRGEVSLTEGKVYYYFFRLQKGVLVRSGEGMGDFMDGGDNMEERC